MSFPKDSYYNSDKKDGTNDLIDHYDLTEMSKENMIAESDAANREALEHVLNNTYQVYTPGNGVPNKTVFVRYPKDQPSGSVGAYVSMLPSDLHEQLKIANNADISPSVFKGEKKSQSQYRGGKKRSSRTRPTRKTRNRNVRGRRASRRHIHRRNAKK